MASYEVLAIPTGMVGPDEPRWELQISAPEYKGVTQALSVTDIMRMAKSYISLDLEVPVEGIGIALRFDLSNYEGV